MISGIVKEKNLESIPAAEVKGRRFSEAQKADDKQQDKYKAEDDASETQIDTQEAISKIKDAAVLFNRKIDIQVEEELNITIVKVIDSETEEVIRQIPPEELVELSRNAKDLKGLLINKEG
ncbi:MAG: flagellar protein FlaG [Nitrospirota bacterium]